MSIIQGNTKSSESTFYPKVINGSLRFNDDDSAYLSWTPASAGNRKTWTWSGWVKRCTISAANSHRIFHSYDGSSSRRSQLIFNTNDTIGWDQGGSGTSGLIDTVAVFRDPSAWYHIVFVADYTNATPADRAKIYVNGVRQAVTTTDDFDNADGLINSTNAHQIGTNDSASTFADFYLANVHFIDGQALTASDFGETKNGVWVAKDYAGTFGTNGFYLTFEDDTQVEAFNTVIWRGTGAVLDVTGVGFKPDLVWVKERDNVNNHSLYDSVRGPRLRLISNQTTVEEEQWNKVMSFNDDGFTTGSATETNRSGGGMVAWCWDAGPNNTPTGHSSIKWTGDDRDNRRLDGFPFTPDLIWIRPRNLSGANNQIYDSVRGFGLGKDLITNGTSAEGGESPAYGGIQSVTKNGFVTKSGSSGGGLEDAHINLYQNATYFPGVTGEYVAWAWDAGDSDPVSNTDGSITSTVKASTTNGFSIVSYTGTGANATVGHGLSSAPDLVIVKSRTHTSSWRVWSNALSGDQYLVLDATNAVGTQATAWNSTTPTSSVISLGSAGDTNSSGNNFIAYCFHDVTGKQKFGTYTGTGASGNTVTLGFRPGFILVKKTNGVNNWCAFDATREPFNDNNTIVYTNTSTPEVNNNDIEFTDTGFILKTGSDATNASGGEYIYAAFAGSYSDYITDYNTDGSIDSRVKASDTTGFSICSFTTPASGSFNFGHGLSSAPNFIISKSRTGAYNWPVYHSSIGAGNYLLLNTTDASGASTTVWGNTTPSTSVVYSDAAGLVGNQDYIAYCWAEKTGYSKFGSYTGGTNPKTITTGFKPSLVIIKCTSFADQWHLIDSTRDVSNPVTGSMLFANLSAAEADYSAYPINFTDTGFTIEHTAAHANESGATYIYAAFADTREAAFWLDQSGNDNDWQPVNLDHNDTLLDSPTNNFCTWNPLNLGGGALSDGNLRWVASNSIGLLCTATMAFDVESTTNKYYWEVTVSSGEMVIGIAPTTLRGSDTGRAGSYGYYGNPGSKFSGTSSSSYGANFGSGDVIGVAVGDGKITFYKNGVSQGDAFTGLTGTFVPFIAEVTCDITANFGQQPFKYDPPE